MNGPMNRVDTQIAGWEETCLHWAEARKPIELQKFQDVHLPFCRSLCDKFRYKLIYDSTIKDPSIATLKPLE